MRLKTYPYVHYSKIHSRSFTLVQGDDKFWLPLWMKASPNGLVNDPYSVLRSSNA